LGAIVGTGILPQNSIVETLTEAAVVLSFCPQESYVSPFFFIKLASVTRHSIIIVLEPRFRRLHLSISRQLYHQVVLETITTETLFSILYLSTLQKQHKDLKNNIHIVAQQA
jgi:hypothetical protein